MKITSEQIENSQVKLNVEAENAELNVYLEKAYQHLANRISVPGFRKGKTPRNILETMIGKEALLQEAMEKMIPELYSKAIKEKEIEPIARPQIEILQTSPVIFNAVIPVKPDIKLGDYRSIRIEHNTIKIDDKEVDFVLQQLQLQKSTLIPVDRPSEYGDVVTMDVEGKEQEKPLPLRKDLVYELVKDYQLPLPGFVDNLVGLSKNEQKSFSINYPADYSIKDLAGKEYSFQVKISEIKKRELPEINDEFSKSEGSEDLAALKEKIFTQLKARAEQSADTEYEEKIMNKIIESGKIEFPPILTEVEIDNMIEEESRNFTDGVKGLESYLKNVNKSIEEHRKELSEIAAKRVTRSLIIDKVSEVENIIADEPEIDLEIEKMIGQAESDQENIRKFWEFPQARGSIKKFIIRRKTVDLLKQIAGG